MRQAPASLWNRVAKTVPLATEWGKVMFNLTESELDAAMDKVEQQMRDSGVPNKVMLAYQTMVPLCLERKALAEYIRKTGNLDLQGVFPNLATAAEAASLGAQEYDLRPAEAKQLLTMLQRLMPD